MQRSRHRSTGTTSPAIPLLLGLAGVVAILLPFLLGANSFGIAVGLTVGVWLLATSLTSGGFDGEIVPNIRG